jgi:hypothetical protein
MKKINPWMIATIILIIIIAGLIFWRQISGMFVVSTTQDITNKTMNYLNENLVAPNTTATFLSINELSGLYNVTFSYQDQALSVYVTKDGSYIFPQILKLGEKIIQPSVPKQTIGNFYVDEKIEICKENGKPIVYFYGSQKCSLCEQELPIIRNITLLFSDQISYHENIDTDKDMEILLKYNPNAYIPFYVIGCKYFGIGPGNISGNNSDVQLAQNLAALTCSVTDNRPLSVCAMVEQLIDQIG